MEIPLRFNDHSEAFADFWNFEDGKKLLSKLPNVPDLSDASKMIPLLFKKDDLADNVIADCFTDLPFPQALNSILDFASGRKPINAAPESVQDLLAQMNAIPSWFNADLADIGRQTCNRAGRSGLIVLRNYSLMLGYQSAAINKPLIATGALHSGAVKRIADTTNFWYAVTGKNALENGNDGFLYCVRTRIVHAYSRTMIKQKLDWRLDQQGEPLNYWDMIATYLGFSLVFIQGLRRLGFQINAEEADGVYHLWKYIGYLIGIPPEIMPNHDEEAIRSLYLWSRTQPEADADSIALATALHDEPLHSPWPEKRWQKKIIQHVNIAFNQYLIGKTSCKILHLPKPAHPWIANLVTTVNKTDELLASLFPAYKKHLISKGRHQQLLVRNNVNFKK